MSRKRCTSRCWGVRRACSLSKVGQDKLLERAHHQGALGKDDDAGPGQNRSQKGHDLRERARNA
jgi:hypothetical protein